MKNINHYLIALITTFYTSNAYCDIFEIEPKSKPIKETTSEYLISKKYSCKENVAPEFINKLHSELKYLSQKNNIEEPKKDLCRYNISKIRLNETSPWSTSTHSIEFYVNKSDINTETPLHFRDATISVVRGKMGIAYSLTENHQNPETFSYCVTLMGDIVDLDECKRF